MKKTIFYGLCLLGLGVAGNAQNVASTTTLTSGGNGAGNAGTSNVFYGKDAGNGALSSSNDNTYIGHQAGSDSTGDSNVHIGSKSGSDSTGNKNTYVGGNSAQLVGSGSENVFIGQLAGGGTTFNATSSNNTYIGYRAGFNSYGTNNVFIGHDVGSTTAVSNRLMIDAINTTTPLIWGNFSTDHLKFNGKVGINFGTASFPSSAGGVTLTNYYLFVKGGILSDQIRVAAQNTWADYVFEDDYKLLPLEEVECFIEENGHLPNVPSAKQIKEEGIDVAQMATIQQEKIEELTLYLIEQKKEIEQLKAQMKALMEQKQ